MGDPCDFRRCEVGVTKGIWTFDFIASQIDNGIVPEIAIHFASKQSGFSTTVRGEFDSADELRRIGQHFLDLASRVDDLNLEDEDYEE